MSAVPDVSRKAFAGADPSRCGVLWCGPVQRYTSGGAKQRRLLCLCTTGLYIIDGAKVTRRVPFVRLAELIDDPSDSHGLPLVVRDEHDLHLQTGSAADRAAIVDVLQVWCPQLTRRPLDFGSGEELSEALRLGHKRWVNDCTVVPPAPAHASPLRRPAAPPAAAAAAPPPAAAAGACTGSPRRAPALAVSYSAREEEADGDGLQLRQADDAPLYWKPHHKLDERPSPTNWRPRYLSVSVAGNGRRSLRLRKPGTNGPVPTRSPHALELGPDTRAEGGVVVWPEDDLRFILQPGGPANRHDGPIAFRVGSEREWWTFAVPSTAIADKWIRWLNYAATPAHIPPAAPDGPSGGWIPVDPACLTDSFQPPPEHRIDPADGRAYTLAQFEDAYGRGALSRWTEAAPAVRLGSSGSQERHPFEEEPYQYFSAPPPLPAMQPRPFVGSLVNAPPPPPLSSTRQQHGAMQTPPPPPQARFSPQPAPPPARASVRIGRLTAPPQPAAAAPAATYF